MVKKNGSHLQNEVLECKRSDRDNLLGRQFLADVCTGSFVHKQGSSQWQPWSLAMVQLEQAAAIKKQCLIN